MSKLITRRRFVHGSTAAAALAGTAAFYGPWKHNRAYAQAKPIKLGLTCDASGQYGNSGQDDETDAVPAAIYLLHREVFLALQREFVGQFEDVCGGGDQREGGQYHGQELQERFHDAQHAAAGRARVSAPSVARTRPAPMN